MTATRPVLNHGPIVAPSMAARFEQLIVAMVLWFSIGAWCAEAYMNFMFGRKLFGPVFGGILVGVAVFAAFFCVRMCAVRGLDKQAWVRRLRVGLPWALCFAVCQTAGWSVLGVTIADGLAVRTDQATSRSVANETLSQKREALRKLGAQRAPEQVAAEIGAELKKLLKSGQTIGDATQGCAQPAMAPNTCRRVAELQKELVAAQQGVTLEAAISGGSSRLADAPKVAEGDAEVSVLKRLTGAEKGDITFWFPVVLTLVVGLLSNFGFVFAGLGGDDEPRPTTGPAHDDFWRGLPQAYRPVGPALMGPSHFGAHSGAHSGAQGDAGVLRDRAWEDQRAPEQGFYSSPQAHPQAGQPGSHANYAAPAYHGAPIHINVSGAPSGSPSGVGAPVPAAVSLLPPAHPHAPPHWPAPARARFDLPALPADAPPVDRSRLTDLLGAGAQSALDAAATFRAACVLDAPGGMLAVDDLYRRYGVYVGARAVARPAFDTLCAALGLAVVQIGAAAHVRDVALKPALAAVG